MRKVVVTGKNGAISVAVADTFKGKGFQVENLSLRGDFWKSYDFSGVVAVVHVAGIVPKEGVKAEDYYDVNYKLTEKLAIKAKNDGVKQFVYISSMAVYGVAPSLKSGEGVVYADTECAPTSDYGKSKYFAEQSLDKIKSDSFKVSIIRVPSVYGVGKTEYLDQYFYSFGRLKFLPKVYLDKFKSVICVENLCELIYLIVDSGKDGVFCPDDGRISAFDFASLVMPTKKSSRFLGLAVKLFSKTNRVVDYYGAVCYDERLSEVFGGEYRRVDYKTAVKKCYE